MMQQHPKSRRLAPVTMLAATLLLVSMPAQATDHGARFIHTATTSNVNSNTTALRHPLTDGTPNAIVHVTQSWNPFGSTGVYNADAIGVYYHEIEGKWKIFNQNTGDDIPVGADFNIWIPPSDGRSFVHSSSSGNHVTTIDNALTNGNPDAILIVTQNWNPAGVGGTYNNHIISIDYAGLGVNKWTIFNQDLVAIPDGASFNVTVLTDTSNAFVHSTNSGNISFNSTVIDHPLTNGNSNAILSVTQNWEPGAVFNPHPVGVWYDGAKWTIFNEDSIQMPDGAAFNVVVLPDQEGVSIHNATAANSVLNYSWFNHVLSDSNPNALVQVTQRFNPDAIFNPHEIGVFYYPTRKKWAVFNQDSNAIPAGASFNVVIPVADSMSFLHRANTGNISENRTIIDYSPLNDDPDAIFHVTQNWNPSNVGDIYNDHAIGVYYTSGTWRIFNQDISAVPVGASFNVWLPPAGPSTFIHSATAGSIDGYWTTIDNPQANNNPEAALIVTQKLNVGAIYNDHPIGVSYSFLTNRWAIFNQDAAAMPSGAAFNVTVRTPTFIFSDDFESGGASSWSVVSP